MTTSMRRGAAAGAVVLLAALPVRGQTPEEQVQAALERARQAGVPVELLESKIQEGQAKGVPMARIVQAVERRLEVLERVRSRFGVQESLTPEELGVAADAAQAGVSDAVLEALMGTAPRERRAVAIAALSQLVQLGYPPQHALDQVQHALQRGPAALMNLPARAAAAQGVPPGAGPQGRAGPPAGTPAGGRPTTTPTPPGRGGPPGGGG